MYHCQTVQYGQQKVQTFLIPQYAVGLKILFQRDPLHKVHYDIGRPVFTKRIPHPHNRGDRIQLRHLPCFLQKAFQSLRPPRLAAVGELPLDLIGIEIGARGGTGREILLDRHLHLQRQVPSHICNAKPSLTDHISDVITASENGASPQSIWRLAAAVLLIAAVRADPFPLFHFPHAFRTSRQLHIWSSELIITFHIDSWQRP